MPNISVVQKPSAAQKATRDGKKVVVGLAGGGLGLGVALALLIEMVLDRTVKRPLELETRLHIPVLLSIPYFGRNGQLRLRANNADPDADLGLQDGDDSDLDLWEGNPAIRPFCEALRDRLIFDFELSRMTHKPKLVAITSCTDGAGASTLTVGLATSLSETCDGKVLLVDKQFDPRRFYELIAEFKASDFEYIIFDMPSLSNGHATLAMAGSMDKVVLVVEAERSNRDTVKRAYAKLAAAKAKVVTVFNKTRSYGPKWLESEV
jgi:polysaccharide biosynthesis transport protein